MLTKNRINKFILLLNEGGAREVIIWMFIIIAFVMGLYCGGKIMENTYKLMNNEQLIINNEK